MKNIETIIAAVGAAGAVLIPAGSFTISTHNTANKALTKTEYMEQQLDRMENKLDLLIEDSIKKGK